MPRPLRREDGGPNFLRRKRLLKSGPSVIALLLSANFSGRIAVAVDGGRRHGIGSAPLLLCAVPGAGPRLLPKSWSKA